MFCVREYFSVAPGWSELLKIGFGLNRGRPTSTWPKIKINAQKILPCKVTVRSVHWGPFYGTPILEFAHFAFPLYPIHTKQHGFLFENVYLISVLISLTSRGSLFGIQVFLESNFILWAKKASQAELLNIILKSRCPLTILS